MSPTSRRTSARSAAVGTVTAVALALSGTLASPASADASYPVPGSGRVAMTGHGFGHGHGMGQYGAQGAALRGLTYRQILSFYYPGTALGTSAAKIRVLISADTTDDVAVLPAGGLRVRDRSDDATFVLPTGAGLTAWRITPATKDRRISKVQYRTAGHWHRYALPGRTTLRGEGQFRASGTLRLVLPDGSVRVYRGKLRSASPTSDATTRATVNVTSRDKYVQGVIAAEMPSSWDAEALRSQAVAARTYAAYLQAAYPTRYYQVCDTTACQVYGGRDRETTATNQAVAATADEVLTYGGRPAFTQFSASSGGWTAAGSVPYLAAKPDPYDGWPGNSVHTWTRTLTATSIRAAYPAIGTPTSLQVTGRDGNGDWGGRVRSVRLVGTKGDVVVSGETMRSRFGLRSNWFRFG